MCGHICLFACVCLCLCWPNVSRGQVHGPVCIHYPPLIGRISKGARFILMIMWWRLRKLVTYVCLPETEGEAATSIQDRWRCYIPRSVSFGPFPLPGPIVSCEVSCRLILVYQRKFPCRGKQPCFGQGNLKVSVVRGSGLRNANKEEKGQHDLNATQMWPTGDAI